MRLVALALAVLVAGCTSAPPVGPPATFQPDLRGTWTGTWGGAPLTVIVIEQRLATGDSGLVIGPYQVLGQQYPTVSGVMTSTIDGRQISTHMNGLLSSGGAAGLVVTLRARSVAGDQWITMRLIDASRLEGTGQSQYAWGPQGPAQLSRAVR